MAPVCRRTQGFGSSSVQRITSESRVSRNHNQATEKTSAAGGQLSRALTSDEQLHNQFSRALLCAMKSLATGVSILMVWMFAYAQENTTPPPRVYPVALPNYDEETATRLQIFLDNSDFGP